MLFVLQLDLSASQVNSLLSSIEIDAGLVPDSRGRCGGAVLVHGVNIQPIYEEIAKQLKNKMDELNVERFIGR